jgi:hypothetical protein
LLRFSACAGLSPGEDDDEAPSEPLRATAGRTSAASPARANASARARVGRLRQRDLEMGT